MDSGLKYQRQVYLDRNPFNDECEVRRQTFKIVRVRSQHECLMPAHGETHHIEPGQFAVCERAVVEGEWSATYACIPCMDLMIESEMYEEACTGSDDAVHSESWQNGGPCDHCGALGEGAGS